MRTARAAGCARSGCGRCRLRRRRCLLGWWGRLLDLMLLLLLLLKETPPLSPRYFWLQFWVGDRRVEQMRPPPARFLFFLRDCNINSLHSVGVFWKLPFRWMMVALAFFLNCSLQLVRVGNWLVCMCVCMFENLGLGMDDWLAAGPPSHGRMSS
jgi:hypothetical protein